MSGLKAKVHELEAELARLKGDSAHWPKLSETLAGPREPHRCQGCGSLGVLGDDGHDPACRDRSVLVAWREHDAHDAETDTVVILCNPCATAIIDDHPRLYGVAERNAPVPGFMRVCWDCPHREGLRCACPDAAANGGPGIRIDVPRSTVHMKFSRPDAPEFEPDPRSGFYTRYGVAARCTGKTGSIR